MPVQLVCCCTARAWSQFVAALQIVANIAWLGLWGYSLVATILLASKGHGVFVELLIFSILFVLEAAFGIFLGLYLLKGINDERWRTIHVWFICTWVIVVFNGIILLVELIQHGTFANWLIFIAKVCLNLFFVAMVHFYKQELKEEEIEESKRLVEAPMVVATVYKQ